MIGGEEEEGGTMGEERESMKEDEVEIEEVDGEEIETGIMIWR